ncbi:hypothetical protein EDD80_101154 [Anseongella ginsenosidimutans]|uniref:Uncharacterized protein n=1 Tax=Anseongella ginsenosidimutans TaxID=496056 RepID=A0A4R3KW41_9SPHI|nr:hypothetical protein EDD80_101154 [Anseongella ginsenosidimutans]
MPFNFRLKASHHIPVIFISPAVKSTPCTGALQSFSGYNHKNFIIRDRFSGYNSKNALFSRQVYSLQHKFHLNGYLDLNLFKFDGWQFLLHFNT